MVCTGEPLFDGKARLFPGCWFVVGYDTAKRVLDPKYFGGTVSGVVVALAALREKGCRFVVAGREEELDKEKEKEKEQEGMGDEGDGGRAVFRTVADLEDHIPAMFRDGVSPMFIGIPERLFRLNQSSTHIRESARAPGQASSAGGESGRTGGRLS